MARKIGSIYNEILLQMIQSPSGSTIIRISASADPRSVARCVANAKLRFSRQRDRRLAHAQLAVTPNGERYMKFAFADQSQNLSFE